MKVAKSDVCRRESYRSGDGCTAKMPLLCCSSCHQSQLKQLACMCSAAGACRSELLLLMLVGWKVGGGRLRRVDEADEAGTHNRLLRLQRCSSQAVNEGDIDRQRPPRRAHEDTCPTISGIIARSHIKPCLADAANVLHKSSQHDAERRQKRRELANLKDPVEEKSLPIASRYGE